MANNSGNPPPMQTNPGLMQAMLPKIKPPKVKKPKSGLKFTP